MEQTYTGQLLMSNNDDITIILDSMNDTGTEFVTNISYDTSLDSISTLDLSSSPTFTFDTSSDYSINLGPTNPLVDHMPHIDDIENMCKEYPALEKAFENFKTVYKMVEQDYKGKLKERGLDDDIPF